MRRLLSSYLQSFSPFLGSGEDLPILAEPVLDERTSVGVQTIPEPPVSEASTPRLRSVRALPPEAHTSAGEMESPDNNAAEPEVVLPAIDATTPHLELADEPENEGAGGDNEGLPTPSDNVTVSETTPTMVAPSDAPESSTDKDVASVRSSTPDADEEPPSRESAGSSLVQRDEELWFEDGTLELVAGNVEFRVYKGPLVAQSGMFKDMLSLPQPSSSPSSPGDVVSLVPGTSSCARVHVSDSPQDMRHFLRVFTDGTLRYEPTFDEISAYVRLGHKYQCDKLVQRALDYLKKYYVSSFDLWFKVTSLDPPSFQLVHRIGVVNLARLVGGPSADALLPVALMCCCMLGPEIADGFGREDGTRETLSPQDLARCFVGRAKLLEATFVSAHRTFRADVAEGCRDPARCRGALQRLLQEMVENAELMRDVAGLRFDNSKTDYINEVDEERALCAKCYAMVGKRGRQAEQHRAIFKELPAMMGVTVEGWGAQAEADEAAQEEEDD